MTLDDGSIQIPGGGIQLDPSNRVWLAEFSTVASWDTIDNSNTSFFMVEKLGGAVQNRIVTVPNGPYDLDTLAASLQSRLNSGELTGLGAYFVTRVGTSESAASGDIANAGIKGGVNGLVQRRHRMHALAAQLVPPCLDIRPQHRCQQEAGRHRLVLAHPPVGVFQGQAQTGLVGAGHDHIEQRVNAALEPERLELSDAGHRMAGLQHLEHLVKQARLRHIDQQAHHLLERPAGLVFEFEAQA
jgi:hypothetical protein